MSLFKYILSPFVEFNEPSPVEPAPITNNAANAPVNTSIPVVESAVPPPLPTSPAPVQQRASGDLKDHFDQLIEDANQKNPLFQGADLKEYVDTKLELDTIPDEGTRIKTAFNLLKKAGLTKDKLLNTGYEYIKLIDHELDGIEGAYNQQYKSDVELKEQQIQAKSQEIQSLSNKINILRQEITQLTAQVSQSKTQLNTNKEQFIAAGQLKKSEIETELQKINQYL